MALYKFFIIIIIIIIITRSAVDIFNTLRVFTKEPIREQEIKWECMNTYEHKFDNIDSFFSYVHRCLHSYKFWSMDHMLGQYFCKTIDTDQGLLLVTF